MIKVIAFDLVGVLVRENGFILNDIDDKLERLFGKNKSDLEFANQAAEILPNLDLNNLEERCKYICNSIYSLKITLEELRDFKEKYKDILLVIATNHVSHIKEFILKTFGTDLFDNIFISAELNEVKPDTSFYTKILNKLDIAPEELCFVDDNQENIIGANNAGIIHTVHATRNSNVLELLEDLLKTNN